jgi:chromosome segregation ATPase
MPRKRTVRVSEADVDREGNAILGLVERAADTAVADLQEAREFAEKLADQLRAAHDRMNNLEAKVIYYQDRTDRAEKWQRQISLKIEQRFFDVTGRRPLSQEQTKMTAVTPPVEELLEEETQRIAAKFAPEEHRGIRHRFNLRQSSDS